MNRASALKRIQDPKFKKVCEALVAEMKRLKIPGVAIGIYHNEKEFSAGFGSTNIKHPLPCTSGTDACGFL